MENECGFVEACAARVLAGEILDDATLYKLTEIDTPAALALIEEQAAEITRHFCPRSFDTCSIVNARSGRCSENCKWCAQSAHYSTGCESYAVVDREKALEVARYNAERGVGRFSLVASGRAVSGRALDEMCEILAFAREHDGIATCASMGLLGEDELRRLRTAGCRRYHCNLETAPSYFEKLCTTHTIADKLRTIETAHKLGFEVCSGGIIGMGETRRQRMELAITLRRARPCSIPINVLCPIPGTPLADTPLIDEDEIVLTVALFRFAHPAVQLRFAGGRARMSRSAQLRALRAAINGAIVGDLLTTLGSTIAEDRKLAYDAGYEW